MADNDTASPEQRPGSPSPWISPSLALAAVPRLDRSVSTASSVSSISGRSSGSRLSDGGRRRGYMRPQATVFSDSARHRDSVMSLGSIAHLQYYFARTGLLDGKGGQLAKARKTSGTAGGPDPATQANVMSYLTMPIEREEVEPPLDEALSAVDLVESPVGEDDFLGSWDSPEPIMLPPTVSTYNYKPMYVAPPPDMAVLRRELREALEDAHKVLQEVEKARTDPTDKTAAAKVSTSPDANLGWYEIQGLHMLDIITLAIRAAKNFYTAHEKPQRLYSIKSERQIRSELYHVLDILKRMATRNFNGGIRDSELEGIASWTAGIEKLLNKEEELERAEQVEREKWSWREGDWTGREREREWVFLKSFDPTGDELPRWTGPAESESLPTPFLQALQNGLKLVLLHNEMVRKSSKQFEEIKVYHTDTAKPYRCAENLRFWAKAAELRWEIKLDIPVMDIVQGKGDDAWKKFDEAVMTWCKGVREEIIIGWREQRKASQARPPTLKIDKGHHEEVGVGSPVLSDNSTD